MSNYWKKKHACVARPNRVLCDDSHRFFGGVVAVFFWFSAFFVERVVTNRAAFLACSPACLSLRSSFDRQLHTARRSD